MQIATYHLDAFSSSVFSGNPAMVCVLEDWLDDERLQAIAAENGLPATAFLLGGDDARAIRWFSPRTELELCGHGTLAAARVVIEHLAPGRDTTRFVSRGRTLTVAREGDLLRLDFPMYEPQPCEETPAALVEALGFEPRELLRAAQYLAVYDTEGDVRRITPDFGRLCDLDRGVVVSAPGDGADFVSRCFAPLVGIPEDAATGSTHCMLTPYWSRHLGRRRLHARQLSDRGGEMWCEQRNDAVSISAHVTQYAQGSICL